MITLTRFDWTLGEDVPFKVNEKAVEEFVNFILNSKAWQTGDAEADIEVVQKKVRKLRADAYGERRVKKAS